MVYYISLYKITEIITHLSKTTEYFYLKEENLIRCFDSVKYNINEKVSFYDNELFSRRGTITKNEYVLPKHCTAHNIKTIVEKLGGRTIFIYDWMICVCSSKRECIYFIRGIKITTPIEHE